MSLIAQNTSFSRVVRHSRSWTHANNSLAHLPTCRRQLLRRTFATEATAIASLSPEQREWLDEQEAHAAVLYRDILLNTEYKRKPNPWAPAKDFEASAAESEWLQPDDSSSSMISIPSHVEESEARDRVDWRQRAPSRMRQVAAETKDGKKKRFTRRHEPPKVDVTVGEPFYHQNLKEDRFLELLNMEEDEDEAVLQKRLSTWSLDRLKEAGYCLTELSAYWMKANQFGRPVLVSRIDPLTETPMKGSVVGKYDRMLHISFQDSFDLSQGAWRLDVGRSNIIFERMRTAISHFKHDVRAQESIEPAADREYILQGTYLRDILLRTFGEEEGVDEHDALQEADDVSYVTRSVLDHSPTEGLKEHSKTICEYRVGQSGIQKRTQWSRCHWSYPTPRRFGGKVKASLIQHTLDYKLDIHPSKPKLDKLVQDGDALSEELRNLVNRTQEFKDKYAGKSLSQREHTMLTRMQEALLTMEARANVLRAKKYAIHQEMLRDVLRQADVVCTTCVSSACVALKVMDFPVVFLDEASMSTEPAALIPLMKGSRHIALIGDHKQLPPVITSRNAQAKALASVSLKGSQRKEYRMHPGISRFPSAEFYNLLLRDGTVDDGGNVFPRLHPPNSQHFVQVPGSVNRPPVIFLDHAGSESQKDRSRVNVSEAHIVCSVVEDLLLNNPELKGSDIGVIAPYVAQTSLLTRFFNSNEKYRERFKDVLGDHRAMQLPAIEIKTVDDRRRLNVGLTRAKRGLFVVGSISTLKTGKVSGGEGGHGVLRVGKGAESWRRYAQYLAEEGLVVRLDGDTLTRMLNGNSSPQSRKALDRMGFSSVSHSGTLDQELAFVTRLIRELHLTIVAKKCGKWRF
ncbi:P-loop containing nucleoside triphosphate hydrolase protein [Salix suchowensis]|nr:P-loop containing nucleoside triphosphate hydrolase protein [Salix suchowensis]